MNQKEKEFIGKFKNRILQIHNCKGKYVTVEIDKTINHNLLIQVKKDDVMVTIFKSKALDFTRECDSLNRDYMAQLINTVKMLVHDF